MFILTLVSYGPRFISNGIFSRNSTKQAFWEFSMEHDGVVKNVKCFKFLLTINGTTQKSKFGESMTRVSELGYLVDIELLDKGIVCEPHAILGSDLVKTLRNDARAYINWMGDKKFHRYLEWALASTWNAKGDEEVIAFLKEHDRRIRLVCDSYLNPHKPETYNSARYWMWNGHLKGLPFRYGIKEKDILMFNEGHPLRKVDSLSVVENDDDFWGFVNTWLEKKWRAQPVPLSQ